MITSSNTSNNKSIEVDMLVDEEIWGHRIYNEQTPWLCFLEFLGVLYAINKDPHQQTFVEVEPNTLSYLPQYRLYLRNILFNNPRLVAVMKETTNEEGRWQRWFSYMQDSGAGLSAQADFRYLQQRFEKFSDFVKVIDFLRGTAIEGDSNKRWSSKFVFPYGPACFYEDVSVSTRGSVTNDRRFFARTGEILYLMLCRSNRGPELLLQFENILFKENKWNKIVRALQPDATKEPTPSKAREGAYLPGGTRQRYQDLADDWLHIFRCSMPGYDALPHIVTIMGLHMLLYILERASETIRHSDRVTFVLEIIGPEKNSVHQLATASYQENNRLSQQAVEAYIDQKISTPSWQDAIMNNDIEAIRQLLDTDFSLKNAEKSDLDQDAEKIIKEFKNRALNRHQKHLEKVHGVWGGVIGLSSRRNSRYTRYTPKDILLKTLVLCTVTGRMEFQEFLHQLYTKYGFIIGQKQALQYFDAKKAEQDDFTMNAKRLEDRLASLGLLKRLSDACAYVENPFAQELQ
ncbi:hypothetical protein [Ktedonobacter racemifer]|uniref:Uncharacterized protein n=1 Tax=Ktedonobacter racemifer DSM 44963 TaxID=485913 RepID=D6TX48_KTERA|nr:hypothetical protein [Ktedonobacter racemifer]EFH84781.1 conserved hypothetical protein [Ktedonobacter racemifer DSM 44963]